jgi:hypothetical protein
MDDALGLKCLPQAHGEVKVDQGIIAHDQAVIERFRAKWTPVRVKKTH